MVWGQGRWVESECSHWSEAGCGSLDGVGVAWLCDGMVDGSRTQATCGVCGGKTVGRKRGEH